GAWLGRVVGGGGAARAPRPPRPVAATVLGTVSDGTIALHLQPFQLATLRLRRSALSESSSVGA
ncbi:hypothetical protein NQ166_01700, partial [Microbacterium sp. zg.Y1090]|uniref:hypothetical protein n=1 Tax=Microbacterium wangruii TaxID=3049073 RepID=UPI00214B7BAB